MTKFEITSPSGKTLEIEGDTPPTEQDLDEIFKTVESTNEQPPVLPPLSVNEDGSLNQPLQGKVTFNEELKKYGKEQLEKRKQWEENHPIISEFQQNFQPNYRSQVPQWEEWAEYGAKAPIGESLKNQAKSYALETIPATNAALAIGTGGAGNFAKMAGEGALLGGTAAGLDELGDNGLSPDLAIQTGIGAATGAILNNTLVPAISGVGRGVGWIGNKAGDIGKKLLKGYTQRVAHLKPSTIERVVQPDSVALDLNKDSAQNLLMNTTEDVQNAYRNLMSKAGEDVRNAALRLPEDRGVWASSLKDSLNDIYDSYGTGTNRELNPAFNNAGDIYENINSLIDAGTVPEKIGKVSAPNLNDIMGNLKNYPIDWSTTAAKDRQAILKQIYMDFARRLGNLSPELRKANKAFSELAKFDDNEGVRQIVNPNILKGDTVDSASRALKNYNSTVTKGNTNRNIQDLEKLLVKNGYEPFLNKIDDINAAMDLLEGPATGVNYGGARDLAAWATTPVLRGIRGYNRLLQNNPQLQNFVNNANAIKSQIPSNLYNLLMQNAGLGADR